MVANKLRLLVVSGALALTGCTTNSDLTTWRDETARARPVLERGDLAVEQDEVEQLRRTFDLTRSRELALALVAEHSQDPRSLFLASRAESDRVVLLRSREIVAKQAGIMAHDTGDERALAARSALDYARRMLPNDDSSAEHHAQLAHALGSSIHLQPMFERSSYARETLRVIEHCLALAPEHPAAHAVLSILNLRLATLPWIARVMAWGAPEGSLKEAIRAAQIAHAGKPSREHALILARALHAAGRLNEANELLQKCLVHPDRHPRDRIVRVLVETQLGEWN